MKKIKILILNSSLMLREMLQRELERDINISVVAKTSDPYEARDRIIEFRPNIVISDTEINKMPGIEFVKKLLLQYPLPIILLSTTELYRKEAERFDSVYFRVKPDPKNTEASEAFFTNLILDIKTIINNHDFKSSDFHKLSKTIAIGASTGGAEALETILTELPEVMPPIIIAQHMPAKFTRSFAERLNASCKLSIKEAENNDLLLPGQVYIAPGGYHTGIKRQDKKLLIRLETNFEGLKICPCIDKLFNSVAVSSGSNSVGVLLTGMGKDGAAGLLNILQAGGRTIGQDKDSSIIYGMPKAAYEAGAVEFKLPLKSIAKKIIDLADINLTDHI